MFCNRKGSGTIHKTILEDPINVKCYDTRKNSTEFVPDLGKKGRDKRRLERKRLLIPNVRNPIH